MSVRSNGLPPTSTGPANLARRALVSLAKPSRGILSWRIFYLLTTATSLPLTANSVALLDANSREFRPDTDTFGYIAPEQNILLEQVNPGVTREGRVIFSVSPDASGFVLRLGDASVLGNQTGFVDLGF